MTKKSFLIYDFMTAAGLSGNELVAYAFLYDATEEGKKKYEGGQDEIARNIGVTIPTVYNVLNKMEDHGLIIRDDGMKTGAIKVNRLKKT